MTGHSSSVPISDPAAPGRNATQAGSPHAGTAYQAQDAGAPRPEPGSGQSNEGADASAFRFGPLPPNPAYEEFQREYAARYAPYSEPKASRRRKGFRAIHMALIFTLGAAAGLTGAWWADSSGQQATASPPVPGIAAAKPDIPSYEKLLREGSQAAPGITGAQGVRGIRSSELPYDGKPPTADGETIASAPAAPLSSAAISSGASEEEEPALPARRQEPSARAPASEPAKTAAAAPEPARTSPGVAAAPSAASVASASRAERPQEGQAKDAEGRASGQAAPAKRAAVAKNGKDQEIERIRRQADDELKKKSAAARRGEEGRDAPRVAQRNQDSGPSSAGNYRVMLAQCEAAPNIFRREQCKWKLCNGMWGKNGCPSYAKPANSHNY